MIEQNKFILLIIILFMSTFCIYNQIEEYNLESDGMISTLKEKVRSVLEKDEYNSGPLEILNNRDVLNEIKVFKGESSYTINKHKIYLCLYDENNEYYNINMLTHVFLHEIAHVLCKSVGHTQEFNNIFNALLEKATKKGIYDPKSKLDKEYCLYNK
jgi:hypothetical protein